MGMVGWDEQKSDPLCGGSSNVLHTMISLALMPPTYLLRRGELDYVHENIQPDTFLRQSLRMLFDRSFNIYGQQNSTDVDDRFDLKTKLMAVQAGYFMTDRYFTDFHEHLAMPQAIFPYTQVNQIVPGRGWVDGEGWNLKGVYYKIPSRNPDIHLTMPSFDLGPVNGPNPWLSGVIRRLYHNAGNGDRISGRKAVGE